MPYDTDYPMADAQGPQANVHEPETEPQSPGKVEFHPPEGWEPPPDAKRGEATVEWEMRGDTICLLSFDGHPLPGYQEETEEGEPKPESGMDEDYRKG